MTAILSLDESNRSFVGIKAETEILGKFSDHLSHADREVSDQSGWMPSLIQVFADQTDGSIRFVTQLLFSAENPKVPLSGRKNYSCRYCSKLFSAPSFLRDHERIHTGEKPYSCEICGKSFATKSNRKAHQSIHFIHFHKNF